MRAMGLALGVCLTGVAFAGVKHVEAPPKVDGVLDDACWAKAKWEGNFKAKLSQPGARIDNATSFAIVSDAHNLYVGVRCEDKDMDLFRKEELKSIWLSEQINLFFAPTGNGFDYYQFAFSGNHGLRHSGCYSESGNIQVEPNFAPEWEVKVLTRDNGWDAEVRIPLSAFYHTRNADMKTEWLVNVARKRYGSKVETSSWSPVQDRFNEPERFRPMTGFPKRSLNDDVAMRDVQFLAEGVRDGRVVGRLSTSVYLRARGEFEFTSSASSESVRFSRLKGVKIARVPASFEKNGTYDIELVLKRVGGGTYRRTAKVRVDFKSIDVRLTTPAYRGNFYPGQDSGLVAGHVEMASGEDAVVTIEGEGFPKRETVVKGGAGDFSFDTKGFREGTAAVLKVAAANGSDAGATLTVRKLAKTARRMAWVDRGSLVVDGTPVFSRKVAHAGYKVSAWSREIFATNSLNETAIVTARNLEARRLVPGSEPREGTKDQMPSAEVLAAIDRQMGAVKDEDFVYYYLCDEPECRGVSPVYLKHLYDHVTARDPYHVIRIGTRAPKSYLDCCDWFETHPYINPQNLPDGRRVYGRPINTVGDFVSGIADLKRPDKVIGFYTTAFAYTYKNPQSDYPTFDEYVTHCWAGVIRGARSLICYAYHDVHDRPSITEGVRFTFAQVAALEPFLLEGRRIPLEKDAEHEKVKYELGGETLVVNVDFKALRVTFEASEAYASRLPSYAATKALVNAEEEARTHTGNLLFGHWQEMKAFGSAKKIGRYKLFDGVRWNYATVVKAKKQNVIGVEFGTFRPTFSSVAVWGDRLQGAKLQVREGEGWKGVAEGVSDGKWCSRFKLHRPVSPDAIRVTLPAGKVELYEIEVFK